MSFSTSRSDLRRDASACSRRCPGQGKLFYVSSPNGDLKNARARDGQVYSKLSTAFLYRNKRVKSCACRPEPWSRSERLRHAMYAARSPSADGPTVIAGRYPGPEKPDDAKKRADEAAVAAGYAEVSELESESTEDVIEPVPVDRATAIAKKPVSERPRARAVSRQRPRRRRARPVERTRRATIFPFQSGTRTRELRWPGD